MLRPPFRSPTTGIFGVTTLIATEAMGVVTVIPTVASQMHGHRSYPIAFGGYLAASVLALVAVGRWTIRYGPRRPTAMGLALAVSLGVIQWTAPRPSVLTLLALAVSVFAIRRLLPGGALRAARGLPAAVLVRELVAGAFFGGEA